MNCKGRQYSDQMICGACGLQWDINDPEPPECDPNQPVIIDAFDVSHVLVGKKSKCGVWCAPDMTGVGKVTCKECRIGVNTNTGE